MDKKIFDLIIIGAGPSGVSAGVYAKRSGLDVILFEKYVVGGQVVNALDIENYPGFSSINGYELALQFDKQLRTLDIPIKYEEVNYVEKENDIFLIKTTAENQYFAKKVILALGNNPRKLELENEEKFLGRGISFCATCDGNFYKGKDIIVYGGGNSAVSEAIYLAPIVNNLTLISRSLLRADNNDILKLKKFNNVKFIDNTIITTLNGDKNLESVDIKNKLTNEEKNIKVDGIFVFIGHVPPTNFIKELGILNKNGYIEVDNHFETKIKGLYSIGDVINKDIRQIVTAVSDGASAIHYIKENLK